MRAVVEEDARQESTRPDAHGPSTDAVVQPAIDIDTGAVNQVDVGEAADDVSRR